MKKRDFKHLSRAHIPYSVQGEGLANLILWLTYLALMLETTHIFYSVKVQFKITF